MSDIFDFLAIDHLRDLSFFTQTWVPLLNPSTYRDGSGIFRICISRWFEGYPLNLRGGFG